jgi:hypothetical protein
LLKIRGKGGGCPSLVLKERELSLVAGCWGRKYLLGEGFGVSGPWFCRKNGDG